MLKQSGSNRLGKFISQLKATLKYRRIWLIAGILLLIVIAIASYYFISTNQSFYNRTIAKITAVTVTNEKQSNDLYGNVEEIYSQEIRAVIMNGIHKGEEIKLKNSATYSRVFDNKYEVNDEVFISITENTGKEAITASILDLKRDKYIAYIVIIFILLIILIGGIKGFRSLVSLNVNILISYFIIQAYSQRINLIFITVIAILLFITLSISLVSGLNKKSYAAMIGTMAGTVLSLVITLVVISVTKAQGIYYDELDILAFDPSQLFIVEVLIGTLGGIMDIAITISSAIKELYDKNTDIDTKTLIRSGKEIGQDIMGTMANTMVFAYISGSIPMIMLWLKNGYSVLNIINYNLSLEIIRALTGCIGIVISIPVTLYISIFLLRGNKIGVKS
ncbi:MAG: YibE/F family protein [Ruminiclostridium sp.]